MLRNFNKLTSLPCNNLLPRDLSCKRREGLYRGYEGMDIDPPVVVYSYVHLHRKSGHYSLPVKMSANSQKRTLDAVDMIYINYKRHHIE